MPQNSFFKFFSRRVVVVLFVAVIFIAASVSSFYFGVKQGERNPKILLIRGVSDIESREENVDFSLFWDAWEMLKEKYVGAADLSNQDLLYGAISGLVSATGDPYSSFFPPPEAQKFSEEISGEFSGIGIEIGIRENQLVVVAPLKDTPADKAGLKTGDKILKIDDFVTVGINTEEAVKRIRGERGTDVVLTIQRGNDSPHEVKITRDVIQLPTLEWKMITEKGEESEQGKIAYFKLFNFYENAPLLFYQSALRTAFYDTEGIILDLRGNPGGFLEASVNIAGWFLKRGETVVTEDFAIGEDNVFKSEGSGLFADIPVVVLIDEGSASASEILAGALKDVRGAPLVGRPSFGKGSVQEVENLRDESMLKITVAKWLTPKGTTIEGNGLKPDYEVEISEEARKDDKDPQLEKALEVLKEEIRP